MGGCPVAFPNCDGLPPSPPRTRFLTKAISIEFRSSVPRITFPPRVSTAHKPSAGPVSQAAGPLGCFPPGAALGGGALSPLPGAFLLHTTVVPLHASAHPPTRTGAVGSPSPSPGNVDWAGAAFDSSCLEAGGSPPPPPPGLRPGCSGDCGAPARRCVLPKWVRLCQVCLGPRQLPPPSGRLSFGQARGF